jgi:hypothetical protein
MSRGRSEAVLGHLFRRLTHQDTVREPTRKSSLGDFLTPTFPMTTFGVRGPLISLRNGQLALAALERATPYKRASA